MTEATRLASGCETALACTMAIGGSSVAARWHSGGHQMALWSPRRRQRVTTTPDDKQFVNSHRTARAGGIPTLSVRSETFAPALRRASRMARSKSRFDAARTRASEKARCSFSVERSCQ